MGLPSKHFGKKITELFDISQEVSPMCSFSAFLHPLLVNHVAPDSELAQHVGTPLTELRGTDGIDPITHGDNAIVMLSSFPFLFPIPLQSGQALHDALRFEAHLDHGEQQVEDVARRVNEKSDRPSQGSRLNKTLNYDLNQALAINISHNAI